MKLLNKQTFMAVLIVVIMVLSTAGILLGGSGEKTLTYNGHKFKLTSEGFFTKLNGKEARFDYFPSDVESINISNETISRLSSTRMIYSTSNYSDANSHAIAQANYELKQMLSEQKGIYLEVDFIQGTEGQKQATCQTATDFVPVILFETGQTGVELKGNCIIARANDARDFMRVKDRLLYGVLGVI